MKIKKDLFLNILYSIFFAIVILSNNSSLHILEEPIVLILKNFILIAILLLWMKALSRNNDGIILVAISSLLNRNLIKSGFTLIKDFIEIKIGVFMLILALYILFFDSVGIENLGAFLIQICTVCLYTLSIYLIGIAYFKISLDDWKFILLIFGPYFVFFIMYEILALENTLYFALIPSNFNILTSSYSSFSLENIIIISLSSVILFVMTFSIFTSIRRLFLGKKYFKLPTEKMN
ncbi:hypothetical protein ABWH96_02165 [Marivirga tractuosa]|uniref:hypothetical protein n=1 Tax=Marivirga tractuosa TaxID=1006 RepID=UPI0035D10F1F